MCKFQTKMAEEGNLDQLCLITGCERELGKNLLEACGNNLEMAVNMHMENGEGEPAPVGPGVAPGLAPGVDQEEDPIRAPIPQRQETLVQPGFEGFEMAGRSNMNNRNRVRSVFDGFRNFEAETLHREQDATAEPLPRGYNPNKKKTLEDLFKPPLDIMFQGDWQSARDKASNSGRWLLVNIQEPKEFQCQVRILRDLIYNATFNQMREP
ncbi:UBX domain-containing protein 7 [Eurytemora carolleeae]|uniref:UBX domain-containing protein 7 n=1 Tax=Eurytemora carolleeae TaxID=1294199 RepID=UPI000C78765A|nr:UBX domain-containing protein 7 [Eurytemora carolleeae]|eukprot:XP_023330113.1 UBX domain-containing protein 7-like [Eurytemora affinis]